MGKKEEERGNWGRNRLRGIQHPSQNQVPYKPGSHPTLSRLQQSEGHIVLNDPPWTSKVSEWLLCFKWPCLLHPSNGVPAQLWRLPKRAINCSLKCPRVLGLGSGGKDTLQQGKAMGSAERPETMLIESSYRSIPGGDCKVPEVPETG